MIRLPDSKTGAKTLYLNAPALAVLSELPRVEGNPFVIVGERKGGGWSTCKSLGGASARQRDWMMCAFMISAIPLLRSPPRVACRCR